VGNPPLKRKGSKLGMIFGGKKRERVNSKNTDEHEVVNWDEDVARERFAQAGRPEDQLIRVRSKRFDRNKPEEDSSSERTRSRTLTRKPSKLKMLFMGSSERPHIVQMTDEMVRLETVIISEKGKKKLIEELLAMRGNFSVKVHFCSAVERFDASGEDKERSVLAQSLVEMFLVPGCMFYITMSEPRRQAILDGNFNQLLDAKREVLEELSKNADVMRIVDFVETLDGV